MGLAMIAIRDRCRSLKLAARVLFQNFQRLVASSRNFSSKLFPTFKVLLGDGPIFFCCSVYQLIVVHQQNNMARGWIPLLWEVKPGGTKFIFWGVDISMHFQAAPTADLSLARRKSGEISIFAFKFSSFPSQVGRTIGASIVRLLFLLLFSCSVNPLPVNRKIRSIPP